MARIISFHSFRPGTGKSSLLTNVAAVLVGRGQHIAVIDADIEAPSIHLRLGLQQQDTMAYFNDYLGGSCDIGQVAYDVTSNLDIDTPGKLYLVPASTSPAKIAHTLLEGYGIDRLHMGFRDLIRSLSLDVLLVDAHAGMQKETLRPFAIADVLTLILRLDQQEYEGTGVLVRLAQELDIPRIVLVVNEAPTVFAPGEVKAKVEQTYQCEVAAVIPHSEDLTALAGEHIFVLRYPGHPISSLFEQMADSLMA